MKTIDLGLIKGQRGDKGDKGDRGESISLEMGSCSLVETKEEAGAELLDDGGGVYTLNLKLPKPIDGGGDMKIAVYDKSGRGEDIYEYIDKNAMTLEGGEFRGSVYLKGAPEAEREAATKGYCDEGDSAVSEQMSEIIESLKECDAFIKRDVDGAIIFSEDEILINPGIDASESDISEKEVIIDSQLFTIDFGAKRTWVGMNFVFLQKSVSAKSTSSTYSGSCVTSLLNEQGVEIDSYGEYYNIETPGKYKIRLTLTGKGTIPVTSYSIKLNEVRCCAEERWF